MAVHRIVNRQRMRNLTSRLSLYRPPSVGALNRF
jgi:hypothetical protein